MPNDGSRTGLEPAAKRIPIERKIDLRFPNFEGLVTGVSSNLSTSGMFIRSDKPEPAGTEFGFALRIEEWSPIQGTAKVIWNRSHTEGPERPAGMGVQFVDLDAQSRRMIRWLVDKHLQEGGRPFDLDTVPAGASMYGGPRGEAKRPEGGSERRRVRRSRAARGSKNRLVIGALVLAAIAMGAFVAYRVWFQDPADSGSAHARNLQPSRESTTPLDSPPTTGESAEPVQADVIADTVVTLDAVAGFIQSWADAWEKRDADEVLAHYADDFDASAWGGRQQWETRIRNQIEASEHVRLAISAMEISFPTDNEAQASFFRSFRSNTANRSGRVILDLRATDDGWKIQTERSQN